MKRLLGPLVVLAALFAVHGFAAFVALGYGRVAIALGATDDSYVWGFIGIVSTGGAIAAALWLAGMRRGKRGIYG